jgi:hypothetical protein
MITFRPIEMLSCGAKCYYLELMSKCGANVIMWDEMLSCETKCYHLELMLKCGANVIMWHEMLHVEADVVIWSILSCKVPKNF